jgi:hypothetical protein
MAVVKGSAFQLVVKTDKALKAAVMESSKAAADALRLQFEEVVRRWSAPPKFVVERAPNAKGVGYRVKLEGRELSIKKWIWTDKGTQPHVIVPVRATALAFNLGYSARTQPVAQFNVGNARATGKRVVTQVVNHPGTEARRFTETFVEELKPEFYADITRQMKKNLK